MKEQKEKEPWYLHKNLINIFCNPKKFKLVTTNFDSLFSYALDKNENKIPIIRYPNLPNSSYFTDGGLIYLHGCIDNDYKNICILQT